MIKTKRHGGAARALALWWSAAIAWAAPAVLVTVADPSSQPIPGVTLQLKQGDAVVASAETDAAGHASFPGLSPGAYTLSAASPGFAAKQAAFTLSAAADVSLELTMLPAAQPREETVEVKGTLDPVAQGASPPATVSTEAAKELPSRPATVADALPLLPGVVRSPGGGLVFSGAGEQRSAMIVNSADVTDPATGQFGLTVPIDSVENLNYYQTPYLAEYGRFTAGLVSVETKRGGNKWKWELNDPFPDFSIRSHHLRGLRDATPRLNLDGPLIAGKLYFSEGLEYEVRKTPVFELPYPYNQKLSHGVNSFAQFDWVASEKHLVTATVHIAPERLDYVGMNYYNPRLTDPSASTHNYTVTLGDQLTLGGGILENTLSTTRFDARIWAQGSQELVIAPNGNSGNYFEDQNRGASRFSWRGVYTLPPLQLAGKHTFKVGLHAGESTDDGQIFERPIDVRNAANQLIESFTFTGGTRFRNRDTEYAAFAQDNWTVSSRLAADLGFREESQAVSESLRMAPRAGVSWSPFAHTGTVVRAGVGVFYDRVPLSVYSYSSYPNETVTTYDAAGQVSAGPFFYLNGLGTVSSKSRFVFTESQPGNFSPRATTGSIRIEQPLKQFLRFRVGYMQSESTGLVILNSAAPDPVTKVGVRLLSGGGEARYSQFEATSRLRLGAERELYFSYVHSHARGDLNDFANYLGSFPSPIVHMNQVATLPSDMPNRFLVWGMMKLPEGFRVAPLFEYRDGFPYSAVDQFQHYVGVPNSLRFPAFLSLDSRFSKDIKVNPKYTVRLSVSTYNLTDHFNPEAVHWNLSDPAFGYLFGQRGRRYTMDFDVLF
ncbi:MAG TPA: TonB-dependent receptor [Bryobacteraceae bacterium]|nr:TonB-dependent receptor [Bryobacteraceae bacterium]